MNAKGAGQHRENSPGYLSSLLFFTLSKKEKNSLIEKISVPVVIKSHSLMIYHHYKSLKKSINVRDI